MTIYFSPSVVGFFDADHPAKPEDVRPVTTERHIELLAGQSMGLRIVPDANGDPTLAEQPAPTLEARIALLEQEVQKHLDERAVALGYDDIRSAVSYAEEPAVPKFQAEGQALRAWRSRVWATCYDLLAQAQSGALAEPSPAEVIALLPAAPTFA